MDLGRAQLGGIAPQDARDSAKTQRGDVLAQEGARFGVCIHKQSECGSARKRLDTQRAGPGEKIEHARAADRIAVGM